MPRRIGLHRVQREVWEGHRRHGGYLRPLRHEGCDLVRGLLVAASRRSGLASLGRMERGAGPAPPGRAPGEGARCA